MKEISIKLKIAFLTFLFGIILALPISARASEVSISAGSATIEKGDTTTITISLSSSSTIGAVRFYLNYDSSVIEYVSSSGDSSFCNGGNGILVFVGDVMATSTSYSVKFKGVAAGKSSLSISYDSGDILDADYNDMTVKKSGGSITVNNPREVDTDCTLSSLKVGEGSIEPAFSASTTSYSISGTLPASVTELTISAVANSSYAKVSIKGNDLSSGDNTVKIIVTAESGDTKTYSITVNRAEPTPTDTPTPTLSPTETPTPTETPIPTNTPIPTEGAALKGGRLVLGDDGVLTVEETDLIVVDKITADIPAGYEITQLTVSGMTVEAASLTDGNMTLVQLSDGGLYVYSDSAVLYPYMTLGVVARTFEIIEAPQSEVPEGYFLSGFVVDDVTYPAYKISASDEFCLVYTEGGNWYKYDTIEGTLQRYEPSTGEVVVITQPAPTAEPQTITLIATGATADGGDKGSILKIAIILIVFILALIFMILYVIERNKNLLYIAEEKQEGYATPGRGSFSENAETVEAFNESDNIFPDIKEALDKERLEGLDAAAATADYEAAAIETAAADVTIETGDETATDTDGTEATADNKNQ